MTAGETPGPERVPGVSSFSEPGPDRVSVHRAGANAGIDVEELFARVPLGWSVVVFRGRRYGLTKSTAVGGRSLSIYAEELGGRDLISANLYLAAGTAEFRPCEMPASTVIDFLVELRTV